MTIGTGDLQRIKAELGFNQLTVGAEPYVSITRYFEQIVVPFLNAGTLTTSATVVPAVAPNTAPVAVSLTLATVVGVNMLDRLIIDVDLAQEQATVQSITGSTVVVSLAKGHGSAGAYPVSVEGGEALVRLYLQRCRSIAQRIEAFGPRAGVKKADEVEFFGGAARSGKEPSGFKTLSDMQQYFRGELCMLLFGVGNIASFGGGGARICVY